MSFILDALRKSERERQRNESPDIAMSRQPEPRRGASFWLPLVALLIGVNLSLLLMMWIMTQPRETVPQQPASTPAPVTQAPASTYSAPDTPRAEAAPLQPAPDSEAGTDFQPVTTPTAGQSAAGSGENLPTLDELLLNNAIALAPMRLDIHVYSDTPSERFVFINMNRYNEGDTMTEGPRVLRINESGVVMRHQGQDFQVLRE